MFAYAYAIYNTDQEMFVLDEDYKHITHPIPTKISSSGVIWKVFLHHHVDSARYNLQRPKTDFEPPFHR